MSISFATKHPRNMSSGSTARINSGRAREVYQSDLEMFRALVGGPPEDVTVAPRKESVAHAPGLPPTKTAVSTATKSAPAPEPTTAPPARRSYGPARRTTIWEWAAVCADAAESYCEKISVTVGRLTLSHWVRRASQDARQKLVQARTRGVAVGP